MFKNCKLQLKVNNFLLVTRIKSLLDFTFIFQQDDCICRVTVFHFCSLQNSISSVSSRDVLRTRCTRMKVSADKESTTQKTSVAEILIRRQRCVFRLRSSETFPHYRSLLPDLTFVTPLEDLLYCVTYLRLICLLTTKSLLVIFPFQLLRSG